MTSQIDIEQAKELNDLLVKLKSLPRDSRLKIVAALENYSFYEKLGVPENTDIFQVENFDWKLNFKIESEAQNVIAH